MSESIKTSVDILGGVLDIELKFAPSGSRITFWKEFNGKLEEVVIEEVAGDCIDIPKDWLILSGASLGSAQRKVAREYGLNAFGDYVMFKGLGDEDIKRVFCDNQGISFDEYPQLLAFARALEAKIRGG